MNKRIKVCIAVCGLGLMALVGSLRVDASGRSTVKGCFGKDDQVCFTEGGREFYGRWMEVTVPDIVDKTH